MGNGKWFRAARKDLRAGERQFRVGVALGLLGIGSGVMTSLVIPRTPESIVVGSAVTAISCSYALLILVPWTCRGAWRKVITVASVCFLVGAIGYWSWPKPTRQLTKEEIASEVWKRAPYAPQPSETLSPGAPPIHPSGGPIGGKGAEMPKPVTLSVRIANVISETQWSPVLIVENRSDRVADGLFWELVLFRRGDHAFLSYPGQSIGYVKAHGKSAPWLMDLNSIRNADMASVAAGDSYIGSLVVDCPTCEGITLLISLEWGVGGWFSVAQGGHGKFILPRNADKGELISEYINSIDRIDRARRIAIAPLTSP